MTSLPFATTTPMHVGRVGLKARDPRALADFYSRLLGLDETRREDGAIVLGAGGRDLVEISGSAGLRPDDTRAAGLFHTAFLLPTRADLARWLGHATANGVQLSGASDHLVSEAIYLDDPEGNGIEVYADRAPQEWRMANGAIQMATERLDLQGLMAQLDAGDPGWRGAPEGTVIGHVHLRVGDVTKAEEWWTGGIGLRSMAHYGNAAVFMSSGGYHHHIGANVWHSRGAGPRAHDMAGLCFVEIVEAGRQADETRHDPWGNEIRLVAPK